MERAVIMNIVDSASYSSNNILNINLADLFWAVVAPSVCHSFTYIKGNIPIFDIFRSPGNEYVNLFLYIYIYPQIILFALLDPPSPTLDFYCF